MSKYKLLGSGKVTAESNQELVEQLNTNSIFGHKENLQDYINSSAIGCKLYNGSIVRTDSIDNYIEDLKTYNFLVEIAE